ncbi:helix-turn-helix domain-containing protein [Actinokineospora sp. 24-640]
MTHPWPPIGENVSRLRTLANLTQESLAERAGISVDLVRRLEQGNRQTALISNLYKIASALDVPLSVLLSQQPVFQAAEPPPLVGRVEALRRVLQPIGAGALEEPEPVTSADVVKSSRAAWRLYYSGEFAHLADLLPTTITAAQVLAERLSGSERNAVLTELSKLYSVCSGVLTQLGHEDLGWIAAKAAVTNANRTDNPLAPADATNAVTFVLIRQGRLDEAQDLSVSTAEAHEPRLGRAKTPELMSWGGLLWNGMTAASRLGRRSEAKDLLNLMQVAAHRLGTDHVDDYGSWFGPTTVGMQSVAYAVETGDYGEALMLAERIRHDGGAAVLTRTRHLLNVANAQAHEGQPEAAVSLLHDLVRQVPEWLRYQVLGRETTAMIIDSSPQLSHDGRNRLRKLATHLGVAG